MIEIVKMEPEEREYWNQRNPLKGYRKPKTKDKSAKIASAIDCVSSLIKHRIDIEHKYFTATSNYPDLLEFRQQIQAHFNQQGVDLAIGRGGFIYVKDTQKIKSN